MGELVFKLGKRLLELGVDLAEVALVIAPVPGEIAAQFCLFLRGPECA